MKNTVAAFANGSGGVILLGVENDGTVCGLTQSERQTKDDVTRVIHDNIVPEPQVTLECGDIDGKQVLAIYVQRGKPCLYGVKPEPLKFYVRRDGSTFPAQPEQICDVARRDVDILNSTRNGFAL